MVMPTQAILGRGCKYHMCFFHVMMNVKKRLSMLTSSERSKEKLSIYALHYAANEDDYHDQISQAKLHWCTSPGLHSFTTYFIEQWLNSELCAGNVFTRDQASQRSTTPWKPTTRFSKIFTPNESVIITSPHRRFYHMSSINWSFN
ncbi:TPA: hypothetical protein N0F65_008691 [Lagenidium giganteum]|uniref:Transposase n=1 Tax=Lagenidium giganteum TaxID=4803 RepID=A0AAV2ZA20_9STRA|nr:TPA: hypothetical protein N0F65_008691 [Lagenidium giganteum]